MIAKFSILPLMIVGAFTAPVDIQTTEKGEDNKIENTIPQEIHKGEKILVSIPEEVIISVDDQFKKSLRDAKIQLGTLSPAHLHAKLEGDVKGMELKCISMIKRADCSVGLYRLEIKSENKSVVIQLLICKEHDSSADSQYASKASVTWSILKSS